MQIANWLVGTLVIGAGVVAKGDPFDPKGYIDHKETQKNAHSEQLSSEGVYRINGVRFIKLTSPEGSVYLPAHGSMPELNDELLVCQQHLKLLGEVLPVRENLPVDPDVLKHSKQVVNMIRKCRAGGVAGPVVTETEPDGAVVEIKSKDKPPPPAAPEPTPVADHK